MFCSYCGKKIPDNSTFCAHCGSKITVYSDDITDSKPDAAPVAAPPVVQPKPQAPVAFPSNKEKDQADKLEKQEAYQNCFIAGWRKFITSPLVLITIIIHSISVFINLAYLGNTMEAMENLSDYVGDFAGSLLNLFSVGTVIVNVLLTVGMWMIYANGHKKDNSLPSTNGLNLITAFVNLYYIGTAVLCHLQGWFPYMHRAVF